MVRQKTANLKTAVLTSVNGPTGAFSGNCYQVLYLYLFTTLIIIIETFVDKMVCPGAGF